MNKTDLIMKLADVVGTQKMAKEGLTERKSVDGIIYNRWVGE